MFEATISASSLSDAIAPVDALVDECKLDIGESRVRVRAVDPANVGMVDLTISEKAFESFKADDGVLGVALEKLTDVLSLADSDDLVHFELDEETRKLEIQINGLEYTLALIDPDSIRKEPEIPDLDLPGTFVFEASELDRSVRAADLCSDHITINAVDDDKLAFSAQGDTDDVEVTLGRNELLSGQCSEDEASSMFSLDYLSDMSKPIASDSEVSLLMGDEFPLKLRYTLAGGHVDVVNMLAPRIQSN